jgi:hypothetical protein
MMNIVYTEKFSRIYTLPQEFSAMLPDHCPVAGVLDEP